MNNFNYSKICSNLLKNLPERMSKIVDRRFGLSNNKRETLEAIGESYGITRERVRQIEREGLSKIDSEGAECQKVFSYFNNVFASAGNLREEQALLNSLGKEKDCNSIFFLLCLGSDYQRVSEDNEFNSFWTKDEDALKSAKRVISSTLNKLKKDNTIYTLQDLFKSQKSEISKILNKVDQNSFNACLEISKKIGKNPEGEIGLAKWVEINPRGIKDKAYLVLKKNGEPLHFTKVAQAIEDSPYFPQNKIHKATVHNELIKDDRFVLVGRGLYGLKEWGYEPGIVREIIASVLKKSGRPMEKEVVLKQVLDQRVVKENTVFLNLQNKEYFNKTAEGKYVIKEG